jgi:hypothetical protein
MKKIHNAIYNGLQPSGYIHGTESDEIWKIVNKYFYCSWHDFLHALLDLKKYGLAKYDIVDNNNRECEYWYRSDLNDIVKHRLNNANR